MCVEKKSVEFKKNYIQLFRNNKYINQLLFLLHNSFFFFYLFLSRYVLFTIHSVIHSILVEIDRHIY